MVKRLLAIGLFALLVGACLGPVNSAAATTLSTSDAALTAAFAKEVMPSYLLEGEEDPVHCDSCPSGYTDPYDDQWHISPADLAPGDTENSLCRNWYMGKFLEYQWDFFSRVEAECDRAPGCTNCYDQTCVYWHYNDFFWKVVDLNDEYLRCVGGEGEGRLPESHFTPMLHDGWKIETALKNLGSFEVVSLKRAA